MNHDETLVSGILAAYEQALNASDTDAAVKLYSSDGVFMPQHGPSRVGIQAIRSAYDAIFVVGNRWSFDDFSPMEAIPTAVNLTTYAGDAADFVSTPLQDLIDQIAGGTLRAPFGKVFSLDEIVDAHRCMEENRAAGKIVVLA